ncbi:hypothetical protein HELRODRAFT_164162 [Helobdella robusta]|uniref:Uncharacterized protein n=1 Tax=Helobdella robusta TaxID=6412 RepID=T1EV09_HELRO|nr:hypothetical protein HELRODRAFT_164162 [Helobdella robusta]ESN94337.1 hypothetical protein HELRODRAFT_164162 [Helobdella robusta]
MNSHLLKNAPIGGRYLSSVNQLAMRKVLLINSVSVSTKLLRPYWSVITSQFIVPADNGLCGKRGLSSVDAVSIKALQRLENDDGYRKILNLAAWNVRTLLENSDRHERRTAIVACELACFKIDIAALSETRLSDASQFEEKGAGYTGFSQGHPAGKARTCGVGFAIRSKLIKSVCQTPHGILPRLMKMQLSLEGGHTATLINCYAPTLGA